MREQRQELEWIMSCQRSFRLEWGRYQGSVLSPFPLAVVVDVVTKLERMCVLSELLYDDDLVLMSETIEGLRNKFLKWKESFESKGLRVKCLMLFNVCDSTSTRKVDPCGLFTWRVNVNSAKVSLEVATLDIYTQEYLLKDFTGSCHMMQLASIIVLLGIHNPHCTYHPNLPNRLH